MPPSTPEMTRRALLPKWVVVFCWLFLVGILAPPAVLIAGIFYKLPMHIGVFGWTRLGSPYELLSLMALAYWGLCGVAAAGLLLGKRWAWNVAVVVGIVGLGLSVTSPFAAGGDTVHIPLELIVEIPFLLLLWRIRERWHAAVRPTALA